MQDHRNHVPTAPERVAWNKGKLIGAKPPLRPKHVWSIRTNERLEGRFGSSRVHCRPRNRDRGEPHGSSPPTPPYVRVRIRRFGGLCGCGDLLYS